MKIVVVTIEQETTSSHAKYQIVKKWVRSDQREKYKRNREK